MNHWMNKQIIFTGKTAVIKKVWMVGGIVFRLQSNQFDLKLLSIFSAKSNIAFYPSRVGKWVPASAGS
mgnify:CR=1 FL=1